MVWFNQDYLEDILIPDRNYYFVGKLSNNGKKVGMMSPEYEAETGNENVHTARIAPYYSLTSGIKQKFLRSKLKWLVDKIDYIADFEDNLPEKMRSKFKLKDIKFALKNIHFPESDEALEKAKERLAFEEMLAIQIKILKRKKEIQGYKSHKLNTKQINNQLQQFIQNVPFKLTSDQETVINEILQDMVEEHPMYRLLQGDVGSGKTIVAAAAAAATVSSGLNAIIMSPTTILANQTYNSVKNLIKDHKIELITSTSKGTTKNIDNNILKGDVQNSQKSIVPKILIGTHALLYQEDTSYTNLGLVVVDEQHRFGVEQRQKLLSINEEIRPHYLVMTATPIPRTMLLALFGDMQSSIIYSKPEGRKDVLTYLVPQDKKTDSYTWINNKIADGEQAFWICPVIDENEKTTTKSIQKVEKELKANIKGKVKILHGKIKEAEKNQILDDFKAKKFDVLLATTVVEVGIDIPNANIIVIESAEQFGLAQLHQLRGRVGRSDKQGYCFLFTESEENPTVNSRLTFFSKEKNGLKISEFDLKRRGPGEVYGTKQSGIPDLKLASIYDTELIKKTRAAAEIILNN